MFSEHHIFRWRRPETGKPAISISRCLLKPARLTDEPRLHGISTPKYLQRNPHEAALRRPALVLPLNTKLTPGVPSLSIY